MANCAVQMSSNSWVDESCYDNSFACACELEKENAYFVLRGLCQSSKVRNGYLPQAEPDNALLFVGFYGSNFIYYDNRTSLWRSSNITATASGLLGKQNWTIKGDGCHKDGQYKTELMFSRCDPDGEFTCNDGLCIKMEERCDRKRNCRDESDEIGCQTVLLQESYNKEVPPSPLLSQFLNINISINLLKVFDIKEDENSIKLQFEITLKWVDDRVTYHNLKKKTFLNTLTEKELKSIWLPLIIYDNTDQKETTRLGVKWEWRTSVRVERKGQLRRSGLEYVNEFEMFSGHDNIIIMKQTYAHEFQCSYFFARYPFDTQVGGFPRSWSHP